MDIAIMRDMVQPRIKADVSTISNEMLNNLYRELFPSHKKRDAKVVLKDTFKGLRHPLKTVRDRDSGATSQRLANRAARDDWHNRSNLSQPFPKHTCNGKRNRQMIGKPVGLVK